MVIITLFFIWKTIILPRIFISTAGSTINLCIGEEKRFTFCGKQQMGGCLCLRHKLCHLNMKYCLGTITCIDLSNIKTNTPAHMTFFILSICFVASNRTMQKKTHRLTFEAYQMRWIAFSICVHMFLFSLLFLSVFPSHLFVAVFCSAFYHLSMFYDSIYIARGVSSSLYVLA